MTKLGVLSLLGESHKICPLTLRRQLLFYSTADEALNDLRNWSQRRVIPVYAHAKNGFSRRWRLEHTVNDFSWQERAFDLRLSLLVLRQKCFFHRLRRKVRF